MKKFTFYFLSVLSFSAFAGSSDNVISFDNFSDFSINVKVDKSTNYSKPFESINVDPLFSSKDSKEYKYRNEGCIGMSGHEAVLKFAVSNNGNTFFSFPEVSFANHDCEADATEVDSWVGCGRHFHKCVKNGKYTKIQYTVATPNRVKISVYLPSFEEIKKWSNVDSPNNSFTNRCDLSIIPDQDYNKDLEQSGGIGFTKKIYCTNNNGEWVANEKFKYYELCPAFSGINVNKDGYLECTKKAGKN